MTPELEAIQSEIADINDNSADVSYLEALANNALYVLTKIQRSDDTLDKDQRGLIDSVTVDLLGTINKELCWAQEEKDKTERQIWFAKARRQILRDLNRLFEV